MKLRTALLALISSFAALPGIAAEQTVTFSVPGMYCASCPFIVEAAIQSVEGVHSVTADSETRTALVVFDDKLATIEEIEFATLNAGYESEPLAADS